MAATAAHVMPKNIVPLSAAMPMLSPYLLTMSTAFVMIIVEITDPTLVAKNAS